MKKAFFALCLLAFCLALPALAQEARDLTPECEITVASKPAMKERLIDRDYHTFWNGLSGGKTVSIKSQEPMYGLYISWYEAPREWTLEQLVNGEWQSTTFERNPIQHSYYPLKGARELRLKPAGRSQNWFGMEEIYVLGEGSLPPYVQTWVMPDDKCDLLVFFAHPDDEALFFGGALPTYAGEMKLDVVAAVFTPSARHRHSELLNSLWAMGVTNYPLMGPFHDSYSSKLDRAYKEFGQSKSRAYVVELFRSTKPDVVLSHDTGGEYGHGMHMLCADLALYAFDAAADASKFSASATTHGTWQASKLYLHLYPENQIEMNWDLPLYAFDGKTGYEVAQIGYSQHISQLHLSQFQVEPKDSPFSSYRFGLARTMVGPDTGKKDFFENLDTGIMQVTEP